jgi:Tol biopolymer transport system component
MSGCANQALKPDKESAYTSDYSITITTITEKGGRVDWSHTLNLIVFDRKGEDGFYDVYIMGPDGTNEYCLTCDLELDHHMGSPSWHPSGEWIVFQMVNTALIPSDRGAEEVKAYTNPGAGWLNNIWVTDRKGHFYQLTDVGDKGGVLHPHFSHDGSRLSWAERVDDKPGSTSGIWVLHVADFVMTDTPHLENILTFSPGEQHELYENHGFSPDDTKILFSGNVQKNQPKWGWDICLVDIKTERLTPLTTTFSEWDEHASYSPDGKKIVWTSSMGYDTDPLKTDFWIMDADGSHKQQLTFFNMPDHPHYMGIPIVAADSCWGGRKFFSQFQAKCWLDSYRYPTSDVCSTFRIGGNTLFLDDVKKINLK